MGLLRSRCDNAGRRLFPVKPIQSRLTGGCRRETRSGYNRGQGFQDDRPDRSARHPLDKSQRRTQWRARRGRLSAEFRRRPFRLGSRWPHRGTWISSEKSEPLSRTRRPPRAHAYFWRRRRRSQGPGDDMTLGHWRYYVSRAILTGCQADAGRGARPAPRPLARRQELQS